MIGCRTALVIFAAVTFYAACQEEADEPPIDGDEPPIDEEPPMDDGPSVTPQQLRGIHGHIDKDKDGKASMMEALNYATEMIKILASKEVPHHLEGMDANKDGKLSLDELLSETRQSSEYGDEEREEVVKLAIEVEKAQFKVADADQDGFLSAEELPSFLTPEIHDGVLEVTVKHTLATKDKDGDNQLSPAEWFEQDLEDLSDQEKEDFKNMDEDGNGFLNLEEVKVLESGLAHRKEWMQNVFDIADKDQDMHLSADELEEVTEMIDLDARLHFMEWAAHHEL